jgi:hypothetical protein
MNILYDSQKRLLANLLNVLRREGVGQLKNETGRRGVMEFKKRVPGPGVALPAAGDQLRFGL